MIRSAGNADAAGALPGAETARRVRELGGRPRRDPRAARFAAWGGSALLHVIVGVAVCLGTWTIVRGGLEEEAPLVTLMDFQAPSFDPVAAAAENPDAPGRDGANTARAIPPASPASSVGLSLDRPLVVAPGRPAAPALAPLAVETTGHSASIAGLKASNARRIVYVVDGSGSLVGTFPEIAAELASSLGKLDRRQSFAVIFFQSNKALPVPPGKLMPATEENVSRTSAWISKNVFPSGRSNPLPALERALALKPDLVFLLSAGVTGAGEYEASADEIVKAIDRLNPATSRTGRRRVRIQCVQLLDRDPDGLLERIAAAHGGPGAFRFIPRDALGLAPGAHGKDGAPAVE